jgi:WD40 repeat protein
MGVLHDFTTKTLTVYEGSEWPDHGMPTGGRIVRVIPEFWQPPVYGGYAVGTEFSPDGRYLLVSWGKRIGVLLYDTRTWQPVTDPRVFPQNLKEYLHTPDWALGVAVTGAGETLIWDQQAHRVLSKLQGLGEFEPPPIITDRQGHRTYTTPSAEVGFASFSPDRTLVAIYSGPDDTSKLHVSVWDVESGRKLREFSPMSSMLSPSGEPLWWNNGRWLLAGPGAGKGVWDVSTGRFQGSLNLSGCDARESLVVLGERLQQRCFAGKGQDGKVLEWSLDGIERQLADFASQISDSESPPE